MNTLDVLEGLKKEFQQHVHKLEGTNCDNSIAIRNSGFECCIKFVDQAIDNAKKEKSFDIQDYMEEKLDEMEAASKEINKIEGNLEDSVLPSVISVLNDDNTIYSKDKAMQALQDRLAALDKYYQYFEIVFSHISEKVFNDYYSISGFKDYAVNEYENFLNKSHMILYCLQGIRNETYNHKLDVSTYETREAILKVLRESI